MALPLQFVGCGATLSPAVPAFYASDVRRDDWCQLATEAATAFGTPCYVSRWAPVEAMLRQQESHFDGSAAVRSWLSFKTHPVRPLARAWIASGRGVEVVSEAEFVAIRGIDCPTSQLLVNGVAKHSWLGRHPIPELRVHFDSVLETKSLLASAVEHRWRVGLRISTPTQGDARHGCGGQFGLSAAEFAQSHRWLRDAGVDVEGVHFHLGQGRRSAQASADAVAYAIDLCEHSGLAPRYIDCGGGIDGTADVPAALQALAGAVADAANRLPSLREVWLENGRYVTQSSAALIVRVLDVKQRPEGRYLMCDGGRTNHALDADNGVHDHFVIPARTGDPTLTTIAGPTCMADDRLGRLFMPSDVAPGDVIVWLDTGAYHLPWETRFSHGLCAVVWADGRDRLSLARARETPDQWSDLWIGNT